MFSYPIVLGAQKNRPSLCVDSFEDPTIYFGCEKDEILLVIPTLF